MLPIVNLYTCKEALARLDDYVDRELTPREIQLVERHLKICHECTRKFAFEADLLAQMRGKMEHVELPDGIMSRLSQRLAEDATSDPAEH